MRRTQLELAEVEFKRETASLGDLDRLRSEWESAAAKAEAQVRRPGAVTGADLAALGEFRLRVKAEGIRIGRLREERLRALAAKQAAMLEARRRCLLLERLKERRWDEWRTAESRELEELASESFLAQWNRSR